MPKTSISQIDKDKPTLMRVQGQLERLELLLEGWMQHKLSNREFAVKATTALLQAKRLTSALISKSME